MQSAFGIDHGEFEKSYTLDSGERVRFRTKIEHTRKGKDQRAHLTASIRKPNGKRKRIGYVTASAGRKHSGYKRGEIEMIETKQKYQGKGVGTAMFRHMEGRKFGARHSDVQTPEGMRWASKVPDPYERKPKMKAAVKPTGEKKSGLRLLANVARRIS